MGLLHIGQAGLELPTSGDLPASASQSAGITSVSHCTWPLFLFKVNGHVHVPNSPTPWLPAPNPGKHSRKDVYFPLAE